MYSTAIWTNCVAFTIESPKEGSYLTVFDNKQFLILWLTVVDYSQVVKKSNQLTDETQRMLKPISICNNLATLDVSEILERRTPTVKPLGESNPIPPITPHPPPQQPRVS